MRAATRFDVGRHCTEKRVEPQRRMVGGRFGWAVHRFPIKGGITLMQAHTISVSEAVKREARKTSFFGQLIRMAGDAGPLRIHGRAIGGDPSSVTVTVEKRS